MLTSSHIMFSHTTDFKTFCSCYFEQYPVCYVEYGRYYKDGSFYELSTNNDVKFHYVNARAFPGLIEFHFNDNRYLLFCKGMELPEAAKIFESKYCKNIDIFFQHNISQRCYIDSEEDLYYECLGFGTNMRDNATAVEFFINSLDLLESFRSELLENFLSERLFESTNKLIIQADLSQSLQVISKPERLMPGNFNVANTCFTEREYECLYHLAHGCTAKETARILDCSYRTVQVHIANIRTKMGASRKVDLANYYWQHFD